MGALRDALLGKKEFVISCEAVPGRGSRGKSVEEAAELTKHFVSSKSPVLALSITDSPGGNPAISPDVLGRQVGELGLDPLVHFSCSNSNRNGLESRAQALAREGVENLLVLTGDYPVSGYGGRAKPIFDIDAVQTIKYLKEMNEGLRVPTRRKGKTAKLPKTNFFIGCAVSSFKLKRNELVPQFYKMEKKIRAGADFIIPQLGYDVRRFAEILKYLKHRNLDVPILGNVYSISLPAAKAMHRGAVPGCVVTEQLVAELTEEAKAADKGHDARLERAAKMTAIFRGMGFNGVHLGGFGLKPADFVEIIQRSEAKADNWRDYIQQFRYPTPKEFYLFPDDPELTFAPDKLEPTSKKYRPWKPISFQMGRISHRFVFEPHTVGHFFMRLAYRILNKLKTMGRIAHFFEHQIKKVLFDCQDCGDCALFDLAYLCPMSQCAKFQRNGPCGGSRDGMCEADSSKRCVWTKVYDRLSSARRTEPMYTTYVPPAEGELDGTSGWANYFLGRDHVSKRIAAEEDAKKAKS